MKAARDANETKKRLPTSRSLWYTSRNMGAKKHTPAWVGTDIVASALGLSRPTVTTMLKTGRLPVKYHRAPGSDRAHYRIDRDEFNSWHRSFVRRVPPAARRSRLLWQKRIAHEDQDGA